MSVDQRQAADLVRIADALEDTVALLQKMHGELFQIARK